MQKSLFQELNLRRTTISDIREIECRRLAMHRQYDCQYFDSQFGWRLHLYAEKNFKTRIALSVYGLPIADSFAVIIASKTYSCGFPAVCNFGNYRYPNIQCLSAILYLMEPTPHTSSSTTEPILSRD